MPDEEFAIRITGIGGTGVVTVAQILANGGAHRRPARAAALDQTGLAQKGGPVVSDVKVSRRAAARGASKLGQPPSVTCISAATCWSRPTPKHLGVADPDRTVAVGLDRRRSRPGA